MPHALFARASRRRTTMLTALWILGVFSVKAEAGRILVEWTFDKPGDLQGWMPNGHLADVKVADGFLSARAIGWDPFLTSPVFEIPAKAWQFIEVEIKCDREGVAEFFWSNTLESPYGGFFPGKETQFAVPGDNEWHTIRVYPFWHPEKKIVRLRFDQFKDADFAVKAIRIVEPDLPVKPSEETYWDFRRGLQGWWAMNLDAPPKIANDALTVESSPETGIVMAPPMSE